MLYLYGDLRNRPERSEISSSAELLITNKMKAKIILYCCFALVIDLIAFNAFGQPSANPKSVYIHTDRAYYAPGESVFFKAYILDSRPSGSAGINDTLHIALIDHDGLEVTNGAFPLGNSLFSANIPLPQFLTEGSYILIASTSLTNNFLPANMFSKIIEIRDPEESDLSIDLSLTDPMYKPGSLLTAHVKISGGNNPISFSYQVTGPSGELLSGKGKTNVEGTAILKLQLPEFDIHQTLKLFIKPLYKGSKKVTGIVIPTDPDEQPAYAAAPADKNNHLKIQVSALKQVYVPGDKVQLAISVTDEKGQPEMANLSVSASNLIPFKFPVDYNNIIEYTNYKTSQPELNSKPVKSDADLADNAETTAFFNAEVRNYFAQCLSRIIQSPGRSFIVQDKNNVKKIRKSQEAVASQAGYSSDRSLMEIIMQIKPYHVENGKITFGINTMNSINNQDGALIVVDGVKFGTDAAILSTIPVQDIAHITVSTNLMDIQRYSAMNNVGIIDITMKKSFSKNEESVSKGNTLYWEPDLLIDNTGKILVDFLNNDNSDEVIISVNGINGKGIYGSTTLRYSVSH